MEVNGYKIEPGANLDGAHLEGTEASKGTTWLEGFDPIAAGVIFED